jgi:hypothetical protein
LVNDLLPGAILREAENGVVLELGRGLELRIPRALAGSIKHGTRYGFSRGCKCESCREANAVYMREWRQRAGK